MMLAMPALCNLLARGYDFYRKPSVAFPRIEEMSFNGVQNYIVGEDGERIGLVLGVDEPTDWQDFASRVWVRTERGDSGTRWAAGPLEYASVSYAFFKGKGLSEIAGHSLGSCAAIVGASLGVPTTCFAPMALLAGSTALAPSWVRNIALSDEPLLTAAKLTPWLRFFGPLTVVPVPAMWSPWRPASYGRIPDAHAVSRYAGAVPARSAFEVTTPSAQPAIA